MKSSGGTPHSILSSIHRAVTLGCHPHSIRAHQELIRSSSTLDQSSILRWSAQRREEEAAQLRTLERSLRDEALAEQLLSEQASLMASDCLPPHMMLLSEQGEFATEAH